jgi:hypothetical protein
MLRDRVAHQPEKEVTMSTTNEIFTIGDVARLYGVSLWQVRVLYERGLLPPAKRVGAYRVVLTADLPAVEAALVRAGYLRQPTEVGANA